MKAPPQSPACRRKARDNGRLPYIPRELFTTLLPESYADVCMTVQFLPPPLVSQATLVLPVNTLVYGWDVSSLLLLIIFFSHHYTQYQPSYFLMF
jgi:hypothetical protein